MDCLTDLAVKLCHALVLSAELYKLTKDDHWYFVFKSLSSPLVDSLKVDIYYHCVNAQRVSWPKLTKARIATISVGIGPRGGLYWREITVNRNGARYYPRVTRTEYPSRHRDSTSLVLRIEQLVSFLNEDTELDITEPWPEWDDLSNLAEWWVMSI